SAAISSGDGWSSCPTAGFVALGGWLGAVEDGDAGTWGLASLGAGDGAGCAGVGFDSCATTKVGFPAFEARRDAIVLMTRLAIANLLAPGAVALTSRLRTRSETPPAKLRKAPLPTSCDSGMILIGSPDTKTLISSAPTGPLTLMREPPL